MPFEKGKVANPGGRPKTKAFTEALRIILLQPAKDAFDVSEKARKIDVIAMRLVKNAFEGDMAAIKEVADRVEGRPAQAITGDNDADPITHVFKWGKA